jgi:cation:H+ antiporter
MIVEVSLVLVGFICLIFGANWMVTGASALAKKLKISDLAIGLTIVAFGTSAPELVVNSIASTQGYSDIILGNVIGSNNFNLFLILGISGMILPITVQSSTAWKEIPISLLIVFLLLILGNDFFTPETNIISRIDGFIFLGFFIFFIYYVFKQMKKEENQEIISEKQASNFKIWSMILVGLAGLIIGGQLVVENNILIATRFGVSEKVIGLTIIAGGTSLPELVTSIVAAFRKNSDIAIGNVIGSNIFNILFILSISSFINPIHFDPKFNTDIWILAGGTIFLLLAMFTGKRKKLDRWEAGILFFFYLIYISFLVWKEIH